ncbi:MAG TPA: hypothetical protein VER96_32180 [Polyangiaceae bacterium]|nr:hypothetical protein [Polyangiaceae bacterium]
MGTLVLVVGSQACSSATTEPNAGGGQAGSSAAGAAGTGGASPSAADAGEAGEAGQGDGCVPSSAKCVPAFECGTVEDGCGKQVTCGSCTGDRLCSGHECVAECVGCVDGSTCIGDGGSPLGQPCLTCDAASGKLVARAQGVCDDGNSCTTNDHCEAGSCTGTKKACSDGVTCNGEETCDAQSGQCLAGSSTCQTGLCDVALDRCVSVCKGCAIEQTCYPNGALNPSNPCQACSVEHDAAGWTITPGVSCGHDDACQFNHVCSATGECRFDTASAGKSCTGATPNTACAGYVCDGHGSCAVQLADVATPCGTAAPCRKLDHCDGQGSCESGGPQALGTACKEFAACSGAVTAPTCECVPGAQASGTTCVDINECTSNTDNCDAQPDACINDVLGFHCACPGNFSGTGVGNASCSCAHSDWSPLCEPWSQVALQTKHACAISAGALYCWGSNDKGQLGTGNRQPRYRPTRVGSNTDWKFVAVGDSHSCGIRGGALYCWGDNSAYALGIGSADSNVPQRVGTDSDWISVTAGMQSQCGIRQGGALYCWGWNSRGQVGIGYTSPFVTAPAQALGMSHVSAVSMESDGVCAIDDGKLYCWGGNNAGKLGFEPTSGAMENPKPLRVTQFEDFVSVDTAIATTCATRADGSLYCWGSEYTATPAQVGAATDWQVVSSGTQRCALKQDGSAYCWGLTDTGAIGDGTSKSRTSPTPVAGGYHWDQIVAGQGTSCGVHDGGLYCWGSNERGIRGTGFRSDTVGTDSDWTSVTTGITYTCGLKSTGQLYCWGAYPGSADRAAPWTPDLIGAANDQGWTFIDAGYSSTCAIKAGDAYCWGRNADGQVGTGDKIDIFTPTRVGAAGLWQRISVGEAHTCGIRDGNLYCWGRDDAGQIGNGALAAPSAPELVASGGWTQVAAGNKHSCAIKSGALYCWGDNSAGQVGNGTSNASFNAPQRVGSSADWIAVFAGYQQSCGIQQGGTLSCWGRGQSSPTVVSGANAWRTGAVDGFNVCAVQSDDKLYCWGLNQYGQLGTGDPVDSTTPVAAVSGSTFASVSVDYSYACGVTSLGTIRCWGKNSDGVLGRSEGLFPMPVVDPNQD